MHIVFIVNSWSLTLVLVSICGFGVWNQKGTSGPPEAPQRFLMFEFWSSRWLNTFFLKNLVLQKKMVIFGNAYIAFFWGGLLEFHESLDPPVGAWTSTILCYGGELNWITYSSSLFTNDYDITHHRVPITKEEINRGCLIRDARQSLMQTVPEPKALGPTEYWVKTLEHALEKPLFHPTSTARWHRHGCPALRKKVSLALQGQRSGQIPWNLENLRRLSQLQERADEQTSVCWRSGRCVFACKRKSSF